MADQNKSLKRIAEFEEREIHSELDTMRHSAAHVMAHAVKRLYPQAKFGIGPTIEDGFYYDMDLDVTLTPEDLTRIEDEMRKIIKENAPFERSEMSAAEASKFFKEMGQDFKVEIIRDLGAETFSLYKEGDFVDLCRGPHVRRAGDIKAIKLLSIAGAYWRGNAKNKQLQRVYGTVFKTQKELDEYLHNIEEAKKRDHRKLGKELELFSFDPIAPGSPFFHPKGAVVYNRLVQYIRELYLAFGYKEVITPQVMDVQLWHTSGHYENYRENMYFTEVEERQFALKPMNCPAHAMLYSFGKHSYRELPLRFADFGRLHRFEPSGALAGLTRVRTFCQDDAHVFCMPDQIGEEITKLIDMIHRTYELFGFKDLKVFLSTRPEKRVGSDEVWDKAESGLEQALKSNNQPYTINEGDGAFYGPKIDFIVHDALKRPWQLGTIQLDFNLPERFNLNYVGADNSLHRPVMIHRAILGSVERFFGVITEHFGGAFPFWLAPVQAVMIPINPEHESYCKEFMNKLYSKGIRIEIDGRNESMGLKTREAQTQKVPLMLVAGKREVETGMFSVRKYGEKTSATLSQDDVLKLIADLEAVGHPIAPKA